MSYATEHIAKTLREARKKKGLSQRALSAMAGVPQGHISKIETGAVDLRLSSLIELARALDLEPTLVPRNTVPAVQSIVRTSAPSATENPKEARKARAELARMQDSLAQLHLPKTQLEQMQRYLNEIKHLQPSPAELQQIQKTLEESKHMLADPATRCAIEQSQEFMADPRNRKLIAESLKQIRDLRNYLAHQTPTTSQPARPAYNLDEDDNG